MRFPDLFRAVLIFALTLGAATACTDDGQGKSEGIGLLPDSGDADDTGESADAGADAGQDDGEPLLDLPPDGPPEGTDPPECASVGEEAELVPLPADIIFVVDNSCSMSFEAGEIQTRLNDFSTQITASGIDAHVVLLSSYPGTGYGICIDPPLGGGGCPNSDDNLPIFNHVEQTISSHNAWSRTLSTHGEWAASMRQDSVKHVVVVTDDTADMSVTDFDAGFKALDPSYADYVHHSVVCHSNCASAAGIGSRYIQLSQQTGGIAADLCLQDFQSVFNALTTEVLGGSALSCEFEIPPPPPGEEFNPDLVNLEFDDGMGGVKVIGRVDSVNDCANVAEGWYYDDPVMPTTILLCPNTCTDIQGAVDGKVSIEFGCETIPSG